jgi:lipid A 3-O-deacylase
LVFVEVPNRWFIEGSVLPGAFFEKVVENDLGSTFEIRSLLGIGYTFDSGNRLSLAVTHKSNASTASKNPGVNAVLIRFRRQFYGLLRFTGR